VFNLQNIQQVLDLPHRLAAREKCTPAELQAALQTREDGHGIKPFVPKCTCDKLAPGTYYVDHINDKSERVYARKA
jgi:hydroxymethylglutaryl-CoA synthase